MYRFSPINPGTPQEHVIAAVNRNFAQLDVEAVTKVFNGSDGVRNILIGKGKDGTHGIKVARAGIDVYNATDDQLLFNSSQNTLKVVATDTLVVPAFNGSDPGAGNFGRQSSQLVSIAHGLDFVPAVLAFVDTGGNYIPMPYTAYYSGATSNAFWFTYRPNVDATDLSIYIDLMSYGSSLGIGAFNVRYYLLQETAN